MYTRNQLIITGLIVAGVSALITAYVMNKKAQTIAPVKTDEKEEESSNLTPFLLKKQRNQNSSSQKHVYQGDTLSGSTPIDYRHCNGTWLWNSSLQRYVCSGRTY
jgi:hypothetical protein